MRILAISDIHNNVACVRKLRAQEDNDFDAIVVAGDIGGHRAMEIFEVLTTFSCPVVYVYGNWDWELDYDVDFGPNTYLLHLNIITIGPFLFTGFSEFRSERDPHPRAIAETRTEYYRRRAELLTRLLRKSDLQRTVLVTHERLTRLANRFPGLLLHVFGHIHRFEVFDRKGSIHANVSALDRLIPVLPIGKRNEASRLNERDIYSSLWSSMRHTNAGNYAVIECGQSGAVSVECRFLHHPYERWFAVPGVGIFSGPLVPEEEIFGDNRRFIRGKA